MRSIGLSVGALLASLALLDVLTIARAAESTFDSEGANAGMELAKGIELRRVMATMGLNATTENAIRVLPMLYGDAVPFVRGPNGEFRGTRNKQAFAAAVYNITPTAISRTKKLIASTDSFAVFRVLLRASSAFVLNPEGSDGSFNAPVFNGRLNGLDERQFTGTVEERTKTFLEMMKPSETDAVAKTSPAVDPDDKAEYLQPPDFKAPKGTHVPTTGKPLSDDLYSKLNSVFKPAAGVWPDSKKEGDLTAKELQTMIALLSHEALVGDGLHCDAGYRSQGMFGFAWGLSVYGAPPAHDCKTVMRIYPNGSGVHYQDLVKTFGEPRLKKVDGDMRHAIYGNVDVILDKTGKYVGTIFFFDRGGK